MFTVLSSLHIIWWILTKYEQVEYYFSFISEKTGSTDIQNHV